MPGAEAHRGLDDNGDWWLEAGDWRGFGIREDRDPPDSNRREVLLGPTRPVLVRHLDRRGRIPGIRQRRGRAVSALVAGEEDACHPVAFFDARGLEAVDDRLDEVARARPNVERGIGFQLAEHVLDAIEQVALVLGRVVSPRTRLELFFRQDLAELVEQVTLFFRQFFRRQHLHCREQVAAAAPVHIRHPLAAQAQRRPRLRAFRHFDCLGAIERGHLNFAAEGDGREIHRNLAEEIDAVAPEERMLLHVDDDIEMARGSAGDAAFALVLEPELLAGGDARRNLHRDLPLARHASRTAARRARLRDDAAGAAALRAGARDGEEPLLKTDLALSVTLRADGRRRPGRRPRAIARFAVLLARNLNGRFSAAGGFLERDLEVVPKIGATLRSAAPAAAAEQIAEAEDVAEPAENVFEAGEDTRIEATAGSGRADALMAESIVQAALGGVGEDGVRFRSLFEFFFGGTIARVAIRVVLH